MINYVFVLSRVDDQSYFQLECFHVICDCKLIFRILLFVYIYIIHEKNNQKYRNKKHHMLSCFANIVTMLQCNKDKVVHYWSDERICMSYWILSIGYQYLMALATTSTSLHHSLVEGYEPFRSSHFAEWNKKIILQRYFNRTGYIRTLSVKNLQISHVQ